MKLRIAALAVALVACLWSAELTAARFAVGSGPDSSIVTLTANGVTLQEYEVSYDLSQPLGKDPFGASLSYDTAYLLFLIDAADSQVSFAFGGDASAPNYFLGSFTYDGTTYPGFDGVSGIGQWVAGGEAGFPTATSIANDSWTYGSGISAPYRRLAHTSHDVIAFSPYADPENFDFGQAEPQFVPVPEPSFSSLICVGAYLLLLRRR